MGAQFTSNFCRSFQKDLGKQVKLSTAFHPQFDGQEERIIHTLEDMLRAYVIDLKESWDYNLPLINFSYNKNYNLSVGMEPFEELYGRRRRSPVAFI